MADKKDDKGAKHVIYIEEKEYTVTENEMTGAQIKSLGGIRSDYQLLLEQPGDDDKVGDTQVVHIRSKMRFYGLPPATFGTCIR
jgi:hypothetical protein